MCLLNSFNICPIWVIISGNSGKCNIIYPSKFVSPKIIEALSSSRLDLWFSTKRHIISLASISWQSVSLKAVGNFFKLFIYIKFGCKCLTAHNWQKWKEYSWHVPALKFWYFVNNCWSSNLKILLHMCDTYNCDYLQYSIFRFNLIDFQLNTDFPSQFCISYRKNHLALLKDRFLKKMLLKRTKTHRFFFSQNYKLK